MSRSKLQQSLLLLAGLWCFVSRAQADIGPGLSEFRQGRFAEALQDWQQQAAGGDARAALFVGVLYDTGLGAQQDAGEALVWYRKAAAAGSAAATFNVAVMLDGGQGTPADPVEAVRWYRQAANMGFARAQYDLALLYESGTGVPHDIPQAIRLYRQAAAQGLAAARMHLMRLGASASLAAPRDTARDTAMEEFRQAQQVLLGRGPADLTRAAALFRRAADRNNSLAEYDLAYCYEHGLGVGRDLTAAYALYQRAAEHAGNAMLRSVALAGARSMESQFANSPDLSDR